MLINKHRVKRIFVKNKRPNMLFNLFVLSILIFSFYFVFKYIYQEKVLWGNSKVRQDIKNFVKEFKNAHPKIDNYDKKNLEEDLLSLNLESKAYIVYDFSTDNIIISKEHKKSLPLASISKIMTGYVAIKYCPDVFAKYRDSILLNSSNINSENVAKECFDNSQSFIDFMNKEANRMELNMFFKNSSGLDVDESTSLASNYGDALSVAKLSKNLYQYDNGKTFGATLKYYADTGIPNTNKYVRELPFLIASKTGFTDTANGNLVTLYNYNGKMFAIVVLGSTKDGRFTDTQKLLNFYLLNFN